MQENNKNNQTEQPKQNGQAKQVKTEQPGTVQNPKKKGNG